MEFLFSTLFVCAGWLAFLEYRRREQKKQMSRLKENEKEQMILIKKLLNELEYLKMIVNGKEEKNKKG